MYKCRACGVKFNEPDLVEYDCESYAGVGSMFADHHTAEYEACPVCGSEDFITLWEEDDDDGFNFGD